MTHAASPEGEWDPVSPAEVTRIFGGSTLGGITSGSTVPWWIAGGYAIELAAGRPVREHKDIDVLLLRRDQFAVQRVLPGWDWQAADPPGHLRPWAPGEWLPPGVREIWCRPGPDGPWRIEIVLAESEGDDWVSSRDARIRRPVASLGQLTPDGIPYLAPEIALFYKAGVRRPKDEADFAAALPLLTGSQRRWLGHAVTVLYGPEHPWRSRLAGAG